MKDDITSVSKVRQLVFAKLQVVPAPGHAADSRQAFHDDSACKCTFCIEEFISLILSLAQHYCQPALRQSVIVAVIDHRKMKVKVKTVKQEVFEVELQAGMKVRHLVPKSDRMATSFTSNSLAVFQERRMPLLQPGVGLGSALSAMKDPAVKCVTSLTVA